MSLLMCCMLVLFLCSSSEEVAAAKSEPVSWHTYQMNEGQNVIRNFKRHSDGTFTSDFTHYLDKIKAKAFVEWLANSKRGDEDLLQVAAHE